MPSLSALKHVFDNIVSLIYKSTHIKWKTDMGKS